MVYLAMRRIQSFPEYRFADHQTEIVCVGYFDSVEKARRAFLFTPFEYVLGVTEDVWDYIVPIQPNFPTLIATIYTRD